MRSKADLHMHTTYSDGVATVPEILEHVATHTDLKVIAITDHDRIDGALHAARLASSFGIEVIIGEEISTIDGHLIALFIDRPIAPGLSARDSIKAIHAQGGLAVAPHPFDCSVSSLGQGSLPISAYTLDAIEGFNASVYWFERSCNFMAQRLAEQLNLPVLGNSDSHSLSTIGSAYTRFDGSSVNDLYRAIQANEVSFAGSYWQLGDYIDNWRLAIQQKGLAQFVCWAVANSGQVQQLTPARVQQG